MDIHSQVLVGNANDDLASLHCQWPQSYYICSQICHIWEQCCSFKSIHRNRRIQIVCFKVSCLGVKAVWKSSFKPFNWFKMFLVIYCHLAILRVLTSALWIQFQHAWNHNDFVSGRVSTMSSKGTWVSQISRCTDQWIIIHMFNIQWTDQKMYSLYMSYLKNEHHWKYLLSWE